MEYGHGAAAIPSVGFEVSPGVEFVPTAFSEIGYDFDPNESFFDQKGRPSHAQGAGFSLSSVMPGLVATVNAAGSILDHSTALFMGTRSGSRAWPTGTISDLIQPGATFSSGRIHQLRCPKHKQEPDGWG